jgi:predicted nucleic acid-binding protein
MGFHNILIDTNICIVATQKRKPFAYNAHKILDYSERKVINGFVSAHTFDTLFYILTQNTHRDNAYMAIEGLRSTVDIAPVTKMEIDEALKLRWPDFEDAIHYHAALNAGCEAIVTRNPGDFKEGELVVLTPSQLFEEIESGQ